MLEVNQSNPDLARIASRVSDGSLQHRLVSEIIRKADKYRLSEKQIALLVKIEGEQVGGADPKHSRSVFVGDLTALVGLLQRAKASLKFPKFRVATDDGDAIVSLAGDNGRNGGWLYVKSPSTWYDGVSDSVYYGKINPANGEYLPSPDAPSSIAVALSKFAESPAEVAGEYGRLNGNCCFCSRRLSDERSTHVGYGETCAGHYGLPWGD